MKPYKLTYICLLLCLLFNGCKQNDVTPNNIDPSFQGFYDKFLLEGSKRGFTKTPTGVTIQFGDAGGGHGGVANLETNTILIDQKVWNRTSVTYHEKILLHELGHLLLKREHTIDALPNGEAVSIMESFGDITEDPSLLYIHTIYQGLRQKYYLDELFDPKTPAPDWSSANQIQTPIPAAGALVVASAFNGSMKLPIFPNDPTLQTTVQNGRLKIVNNDTTYYSLGFKNFLPAFNIADAKNFDLRFRFKSNYSIIDWTTNSDKANQLLFYQKNTLNTRIVVGDGTFRNLSATAAAGDWNEMVIQYDGSLYSFWLNGQMLFKGDATNPQASDVWRAATVLGPKDDVEFDYIRLYKK